MCDQLTPEILGLIQDGKVPLEIAQKVLNFENASDPLERADLQRESFSDEMVAISQALAYRQASAGDSTAICRLLNQAYAPEVVGSESFRLGDFMSAEDISTSIDEGELNWLIMEVPEGRQTDSDEAIIGICSYSTDGISRRNGEIEGTLGSVRALAVVPKMHGLCVGQRLLGKVEYEMKKCGCVRMMVQTDIISTHEPIFVKISSIAINNSY
jgi:N-acetylglutamate synthase-like GNAT family acetyltransferase